MQPGSTGTEPDAVAVGGPERCADNDAEQPAGTRADQRAGAGAHGRTERAAQLCTVGEAELGSRAKCDGAGAVDGEPGRDLGADAIGSAVVERDAEPGSGSDAGSQHAAR